MTRYLDDCIVNAGDTLTYGKPQTSAIAASRSSFIRHIEWFKYFVLMLFGNTNALINDLKNILISLPVRSKCNYLLPGRSFKSIVYEIKDQNLNQIRL
ncbi:hypothetical protein D3C78_1715670 [compost metagenome]